MKKNYDAIFNSPIGKLGIITRSDLLTHLDFLSASTSLLTPKNTLAKEVGIQLASYFKNSRFEFDLPFQITGTLFQQKIWQALQLISLGETATYADIAFRIKNHPRAVGQACKRNPLPIIIPCHRVVARHSLGGYSGETAGETLQIKKWLLKHEGVSGHHQ